MPARVDKPDLATIHVPLPDFCVDIHPRGLPYIRLPSTLHKAISCVMDLLAHACYGATLCSRSGLAGGQKGLPGTPWYRDVTVHAAVLFSLLPDMLSMWIPFALHLINGTQGNFFHDYSGAWLLVYRLTHSLVTTLAVSALVWRLRRKFAVPSLAWTVHVLCDAVSHGSGKFKTMPFYPFSTWGIHGVAFWRHHWFVGAYWLVLVGIMICIACWRRGRRSGHLTSKC